MIGSERGIEADGHVWTVALPQFADGISDGGGALAQLDALSAKLGVELPVRYRNLAPIVRGLCPQRSAFVVWDPPEGQHHGPNGVPDLGKGWVRNLGAFALLGAESPVADAASTVVAQLALLEGVAPGLFPFAFDLRGNLVCLDYGENWEDRVPSVAYYDRARQIGDDVLPVSPSFPEFLDELMDGEANEGGLETKR